MIKVELPKQRWLESATCDFFKEGFWRGVYGLTLNFTGESIDSHESLLAVMEKLLSAPTPKRKIVRLKGFIHQADELVGLLVRSFKDYGYSVQAVVKDPNYSWFDKLDWSILQVAGNFIPFYAQEIWYKPPATDVLEEPKLPPPVTNKGPMLLYLTPDYSVSSTQDFMLKSKFNWSLM